MVQAITPLHDGHWSLRRLMFVAVVIKVGNLNGVSLGASSCHRRRYSWDGLWSLRAACFERRLMVGIGRRVHVATTSSIKSSNSAQDLECREPSLKRH